MPQVFGRYVEMRFRSAPTTPEEPPLVVYDDGKPFIVIEDGPDYPLEYLLMLADQRIKAKKEKKTVRRRVKCGIVLTSKTGLLWTCNSWVQEGKNKCYHHEKFPTPRAAG